VEVVLFFETPFDWDFLRVCRHRGIRTVIVPMYEWYPRNPPEKPDKFICPSLLDVRYFPGSPFLTVPVDPDTWRLRTRSLRFLHNAGHIGHRNHKGTEELIKALPLLRPEIKLTIRSQTERIYSLLKGASHSGLEVFVGDCPREMLFRDYDVYVAPEKFNGLSLPLQEAYASGMMVMGSDRFPMNTWLPQAALIPVSSSHRANIGGHNFFDEAEINPAVIAGHMNEWYDQDITEFSVAGAAWAFEHSWEVMKPKWLEELSR
jgi:glycosyltransferase involved in cell wall biosynthesis